VVRLGNQTQLEKRVKIESLKRTNERDKRRKEMEESLTLKHLEDERLAEKE
jgi:hypothetical protein